MNAWPNGLSAGGAGGWGGLGREEGDKLQEQQKFGLWGAHVTKL